MSKFFDIKFLKFVAVGILNTAFSAAIMFLMYDLFHFGYWGSSAVSYILASILSFFLNKKFTFKNDDSIWKTAIKFSINVAVCYVLAYSISKPLVILALSSVHMSTDMVNKISMLFGMVIFTMLNYVGQRFFAFKQPEKNDNTDANI